MGSNADPLVYGSEQHTKHFECAQCGYTWPIPLHVIGQPTDVVVISCLRCRLTPIHIRPGTFQTGDWVVSHEKPPAMRIFDSKPTDDGLLAITWIREDETVHIGYCPPQFIRPAAAWEPRRP